MFRPCLGVLSLLLMVSVRLVWGETTINKAVNGSVTFNLMYYAGATEITWKFGQDKLAELDNAGQNHFYPPMDNGRASATFDPGSLTINQLQKEDSNTYTAEIQVGRETHTDTFTLKVFDVVQRPNVTCTQEKETNSLVLHCHSPGNVQYQWQNSSGFVSAQQNLTVTDPSVYTDGNLTCHAQNPGSSKFTSFLLSSCVQEEKGHRTHIIMILLFVCVVIVIVSGIILYKKGKFFHRAEQPKPEGQNLNSPETLNAEDMSP
ncbi:SLAM family member 6 [Xenopus laevis]|uniref:SLAM family member 6 n=2 Tax=Xenopus laevis TaxID=8355 RepID=A0A1L8H5U2_XENLA|nr:SLAM family member 6 [Xenopus laevis]OCT91438.1 hypothetical protein XELAEV_18014492mg [Xenopus laevis]